MWMQSKSKMWHKVNEKLNYNNKTYPMCQSYNLDKPNYLDGIKLETPPENVKICKKCSSNGTGNMWT